MAKKKPTQETGAQPRRPARQPMDQAELIKTIEKAARDGARELDLRGKEITQLPEQIGRLVNLRKLDLSGNQLSALPEQIGQLVNLQTLNLDGNRLVTLPEQIGQLPKLQELLLEDNELSTLPDQIGQLVNLQKLSLSDNQLSTLPEQMGQLVNLLQLNLDRNQLSALPEQIGQLVKLKGLHLQDNQLRTLPEQIGELTELSFWAIFGNRLERIPRSIGNLTHLRDLYIGLKPVQRGNPLTDLPAEMRNLTQLRHLEVSNCPQLNLPPEIVAKTNSPQEILDFYFRARTQPARPLNEAKVLVVGEAEVGKTSLIKQLFEIGEFDPREDQTHGIVIHRHDLVLEKKGKQKKRTVRLNVWDFGGQEIMHATHQFFLTKRSLYLLVLDSRQNELQSRIEYWLKLIHSFGANSPVIVVCNKCDQQQMQLDWSGLQAKYPQIKAFIRRVSCYHNKATGKDLREGLDQVHAAIADQIARLEHVETMFPVPWFNVKQRLEDMSESYMPYTHYSEMCQDNGITEEGEQRQLIGFLHDLGIVLHFSDHPLLRDTNVLNPLWVTNAVYRILNCNELFQSQGVLLFSELGTLLKSVEMEQFEYPEDRQLFVIEIMRRFELCFDFEGRANEQFLIPGLLPLAAPDTGDWTGSLGFQYRYEVLPQSVMSRFIVRMNKRISEHTYWRKGVVLASQDGRNRGLVKADFEEMSIDIRIGGPVAGRRPLLASIRDQFAEIHDSIPRLGHGEFVPIPGTPDVAVSYTRLLDLEERARETDYVEEIKDDVIVKDLLDGVSDAKAREEDRRAQNLGRHEPRRPAVLAGSAPSEGKLSALSSWRFFSISCGLGAIVLAIVLWLIPSTEWRAAIGGLLGLGIGVTAFVMSMNPALFYRRMLTYVIPAGLLINALGFSFDTFFVSDPASGSLRWDGSASAGFFFAWAAVVGFLVWGDSQRRR